MKNRDQSKTQNCSEKQNYIFLDKFASTYIGYCFWCLTLAIVDVIEKQETSKPAFYPRRGDGSKSTGEPMTWDHTCLYIITTNTFQTLHQISPWADRIHCLNCTYRCLGTQCTHKKKKMLCCISLMHLNNCHRLYYYLYKLGSIFHTLLSNQTCQQQGKNCQNLLTMCFVTLPSNS